MEFGNTWLPDLNKPGMRTEDKLRALNEYLIAFDKQVRHVLSNIDEENFSETMLNALKDTSGKVKALEEGRSGGQATSVDGVKTDEDGNVPLGAVRSVNGISPDPSGKVEVAFADLTGQEKVMNVAFPVGSCYTTSTNTNPASILGVGTWTLVDKVFSTKNTSDGFFTPNTTNVTTAAVVMYRNGHSIRIRATITPSVALADTTVVLGTFDWDAVGISTTGQSIGVIGFSDGGNGISSGFVLVNKNFEHRDCVTKTSGGSLAAAQSIEYNFVIVPRRTDMLDSACNQFIWRRTA